MPEWERKGAAEIMARFYDEIWVYGLEAFYRPLDGLSLSSRLCRNIAYTGYLRREVPQTSAFSRPPKITRQPFILVTAGGGGTART